jgi:hypothetical protein
MHIIGRRNFLAGVGLGAGSHLLGGIFKSLLPEALGAPLTRKRLILYTAANGFLERFYTCANRSPTDFDLSPVFQPLAAHKSQMVIASKFFNPFSKALHGNQHATLVVKESTNPNVSQERGPPGGISIDRFLAKQIGKDDAFSSTASGRGICVSADGPGQSFPSISSPGKAFDTYFAAAGAAPGEPPVSGGGSLESNFAKNRSFLDVLRGDIGRMNQRLAGPEKAKLDQYLESLRSLETQLQQRSMAAMGCVKGARPTAETATHKLGDVLAAHTDVILAAQKCGLTRISHILFEGMEGPHIRYDWLNDPRNHHDDHHAGDMTTCLKIATWWMSQINRMVEGLAATKEGNGTMLDNSLVVFINTCGGSHHRGQNNHAVVFIGGAGGALKTGRYLTYPEGKHCISDVYVSLANMLDVPITSFGEANVCKGPLPGLI